MKLTTTTRKRGLAAVAVVAALGLMTACTAQGGSSSSTGTTTISVWSHQGTEAEAAATKKIVAAFDASQSRVKVKLRFLPEATYTTTITNTPKSQMPDVLDIDGPTLSKFAYAGKLVSISQDVSKATLDNASGGAIAQGTYNNKLYALPQFDSAMGLFGNKKLLDAAGVKYPTSIDSAWTPDQFSAALKTLAAANPSGKSLDISESGLSGEWGTYGFAPLVWSAGGNIMKNGKASGALNSAASVKALTEFSTWKPYVDPNADGNAFTAGRVALGLGGHWLYPTYSKTIGSDLLVLPMPNMGNGEKAGAGSWTWGIGSSTKNAKAAGEFLDYLLSDSSVKAMTDANGAPPATKSAFAADGLYKAGGALEMWGKQLASACSSSDITSGCVAVYRPGTPGYPTITAKFSAAVAAIWGGADPTSTLTAAARAIDQNFSDNNGYK